MYSAAMKQSKGQWEECCKLQYENNNLQKLVQSVQSENSHYQTKLHPLMEKCKDYHVQIEQLNETNKDLCRQIQQLEGTISPLNLQIQQLKSEKKGFQIHQDYKQLKKQNADYKAQIQQLQTMQRDNSRHQSELHPSKEKCEKCKDYRVQVQQLKGEKSLISSLNSQIQQLKSEKSSVQQENDKLAKKLNADYKAQMQLQAETALAYDCRLLNKQNADYRVQIQDLQAEARYYKAQMRQLQLETSEMQQLKNKTKTLSAQISTMEKELTDLRFMTQVKHLQDATEWKNLIMNFKHLQEEYAQEFIALVEKEQQLIRKNQEQNWYVAQEHVRIAQEIDERNSRSNEMQLHCYKIFRDNARTWNNRISEIQRMMAASSQLDRENDQLRQKLNNKVMLQQEQNIKDLNILLAQFDQLELRCGFLMRTISSSVLPKENLDRLFGNVRQKKVFKTLSDQIDEQWKKKYNQLKGKHILHIVLTAVIVFLLSLGIVYVSMP